MGRNKKPEKKKFRRSYSQKTLKVLFALSGNQCAYPGCENPVVVPTTEASGVHVSSQICHIYSLNSDSRSQEGLTERELNAPENLILLCPTHHDIIDGQHESYPPNLLKRWKQEHEAKVKGLISRNLAAVPTDVLSHPYFPRALVDQIIEEQLGILRKSRFFVEYDRVGAALALAKKLTKRELSVGTDGVRSRALAWCARLLSRTEYLDKAEEYLSLAKTLGNGPEIDIAGAFIASQKGDRAAALGVLAEIAVPAARSAAVMVVAHHDGPQAALDWMRAADIDAGDLDAEGKNVLLMNQLQLGLWDGARKTVHAVIDDDRRDTPVLYRMTAVTHLLHTVPAELRGVVFNQLPLQPTDFPFASDAAAIDARRVARQHFVKAAEVARQLNCPEAAAADDEYALWLELADPDQASNGRQRLESRLRGPKPPLRLVNLGLQFEIKLDLAAVEREIERQIALNGAITRDAAIARFALTFTQKSTKHAASYIAQHRNELAQFLDPKSMRFLEIELLSRAGQPERATECLNALLEQGLSSAEEGRLRRIIAEAEGADPIEARREQFDRTDSLSDLASLVDELEKQCQWDELCDYSNRLFQRTHSLHDAERLATALSEAGKSELVVALLRENADLLARSNVLQMLYCWSLYYEGHFLEARAELLNLSDDPDNQNYRSLQVNLGIGLGDWNSLSVYLANECQRKEDRSAKDLVRAAQLALHLGSPHAKELLFSAAARTGDDAEVLAAAYFLASSGGWEDDPEVYQWLHRAAELSGDDGPIQRMSLKDVQDRRPEWERRESETWQLLGRGDIPMFMAAQALNKSVIDLMLLPALANQAEDDPRRRGAVLAYSGKRQPMSLNLCGAVGIDATALLSLSFLNLLDAALDAFDQVYLPHSTLAWLFEEKRRASFHQPSRVKDAHRILALLAAGILEKFVPRTVPDSELSAQVGDELASLIAEAEKDRENDSPQCIVVRSSPVHRVATLMEEEADLAAHAAVLSSCQAIIDKLREKAQITIEAARKARDYLRLHEKAWPNQPEISDGAVLYLDDLAATYFLHLGMLERLKAAGFTVILSPAKVDESNLLISYEGISEKVNEAIERIRSSIMLRIESGKIKFGKRINIDREGVRHISAHTSVGIVTLTKYCDLIISDDRFLNQHLNVEHEESEPKIFSTLDIMESFVSSNIISHQFHSECKALLRRGGYFFIPLDEEELSSYLDASSVQQDRLVETAELKAIRENILRVRMSSWLQLPKEAPWLDALLKTFIMVLKSEWKDGAELSAVRARSDWIMDQVDVRGWHTVLAAKATTTCSRLGVLPISCCCCRHPRTCRQRLEANTGTGLRKRPCIP